MTTDTAPQGASKHIIRTSDRNTFRKCRRQWDFTSKIRQNYEPTRMDKNLAFGIAVHAGLEVYYDPTFYSQPVHVRVARAKLRFGEELHEHFWSDDLSEEDRTEYAELEELGDGMLYHYGKWASGVDHFKPIMVEYEFEVPVTVPQKYTSMWLTDEPYQRGFDVNDTSGYPHLYYQAKPVVYQGRIDLMVEDEAGELWLWDHKTASRFDDTTWLDLDTQVSSYAWAMQQIIGKPIAGIVYNELRKTAPSEPRVLKSGKLSKDKSQGTTYDLYVKAIEQGGHDPADYQDILHYLLHSGDDYFRRTQLHRTQIELAHQEELIFLEAMDMLGEPAIYPNPSRFNCNYCSFRAPCLVTSEGGDVEFVLSDPRLYKVRDA